MTTDTDKASDKLVEMARDTGAGEALPGIFWMTVHKLAAFRSAILADAAKDVQAVAWGIFANNGNIRFWACDKASADSQAAKTGGDVEGLCLASTLAAAQALNAELVARVEGLEKDAARYRHLRGHRGMEHDSFAVHSTLTDDLLWGDDLDHEIDRIAAIAARSGT